MISSCISNRVVCPGRDHEGKLSKSRGHPVKYNKVDLAIRFWLSSIVEMDYVCLILVERMPVSDIPSCELPACVSHTSCLLQLK